MFRHPAKPVVLAFLAALTCACGSPAPAPTEAGAEVTVLRRVGVIDAVNGIRPAQFVIVRGDRIVEVGAAEELTVPEGATVIDAEDAFLIPGLWDAHVHLTFTPELEDVMFPLFLANGITSVRDTGGLTEKVLPWQQRARANPGGAPRVFVAGPLIDGVPAVYDGSDPFRPEIAISVGSVEAAEREVDELAAAGVDLIKAYELLAPDVFAAVVARAATHGLPVTGHAPLSMDAAAASAAGMSSMEHMRNLEMSCSGQAEVLQEQRRAMLAAGAESGGALRSAIHSAQRLPAIESQDDDRCAELVRVLAENGTWQVPTLTIVTPRVTRLHARASWRENFRYLPVPVRSQWTTSAEQMAADPPDAAATALTDWAMAMVARLRDGGVGLMAGTDTPIFFLTPGFSLHEELVLLVQAGLSTMQALEAATLRPAQYFGLDGELGTIEPGKLADLVLLDANPLDDIEHTKRIRAVWAAGRRYDRADLDEILAGHEARGATPEGTP